MNIQQLIGKKGKNPLNSFFNTSKNIPKSDKIGRDYFTPTRHAEDMTAAQKFGQTNLKRLQKLGSGRDRDVYALDQGKVLKIAKNPGGLEQNSYEKSLDELGQLRHYETGKDYTVMERASPPGKATTKFLKPITQAYDEAYRDYNTNRYGKHGIYAADDPKIQEALEKSGISAFREYGHLSVGDLTRKANWGERNGQPVLIDAGTLNAPSLVKHRVKDFEQVARIDRDKPEPWQLRDWREIRRDRSTYRHKGKVYPYELDKYYNKPQTPYPEAQLLDFPKFDIYGKDSLFQKTMDTGLGTVYKSPYQEIIISKGAGAIPKRLPSVDDIGYFYDMAPTDYAKQVERIELGSKPTLGYSGRSNVWGTAQLTPDGKGLIQIYPKKAIEPWTWQPGDREHDIDSSMRDAAQVQALLLHETGHIIAKKKKLEEPFQRQFHPLLSPTMYPVQTYLRTAKRKTEKAAIGKGSREDIAESWAVWHNMPTIDSSGKVRMGSDMKPNPALRGVTMSEVTPARPYATELFGEEQRPLFGEEHDTVNSEESTNEYAVHKKAVEGLRARKGFLIANLGEGYKYGTTPRQEYEESVSPKKYIEEGTAAAILRENLEKPKTDEEYQKEYEAIKGRPVPTIPDRPLTYSERQALNAQIGMQKQQSLTTDDFGNNMLSGDTYGKNDNQLYLSAMNLPKDIIPGQEYSPEAKVIDQSTREPNTSAFIMHTIPDRTFIGQGFKYTDFDNPKNIQHLSNVLGHEETHSVLSKMFPKDIAVTSGLDNISIKGLYYKRTDPTIMNPLSTGIINPRAVKEYKDAKMSDLAQGGRQARKAVVDKYESEVPLIDTYGKSLALSKAPLVTLYHGTTKDNAERIVREGLIPQVSWGGGMGANVFLTPNKSAALLHAQVGPEKKTHKYAHDIPRSEYHPEQAAVLKVTIPREQAIKGMIEMRNPETLKEIFEEPTGGKVLKADIYEAHIPEHIPPSQIELMDINRFKQRAFSESRNPDIVGEKYRTPVWHGPEQRKSYGEWRDYDEGEILSTLPPTRLVSDDKSKGMAYALAYYDENDRPKLLYDKDIGTHYPNRSSNPEHEEWIAAMHTADDSWRPDLMESVSKIKNPVLRFRTGEDIFYGMKAPSGDWSGEATLSNISEPSDLDAFNKNQRFRNLYSYAKTELKKREPALQRISILPPSNMPIELDTI